MSLVKSQIIVSVLMIFSTVILLVIEGHPKLQYTLTFMNAITFFLTLFSNSFDIGEKDSNPKIERNKYPLKGFTLSVGVLALILATFIAYRISWKFFPHTETAISAPCMISQLLFVLMTSPVYKFIGIVGSTYNPIALVVYLIITSMFCGLGYYCGYKQVDFLLHIRRFMFEKKK